jgi:hypothetical protein
LDSKDSKKAQILGYLDMIMTSIFVIEMLLKIIAKGLCANGEDSYLRQPWNILDFIIVLVSLISLTF